jgi:hypothetical protein
MKTLVNEVWTQIAYHNDGHLVHLDKRTGKQTISFRVWPDIASANRRWLRDSAKFSGKTSTNFDPTLRYVVRTTRGR